MNYPTAQVTPRQLHTCDPEMQLAYLAFCDALTSALGDVPGIELTPIFTAFGAEFLDSYASPWLRVFADPDSDALVVALRARQVTASLARRLHVAYPNALQPAPPAPFALVHPDTESHFILLRFHIGSMCLPLADFPGVQWREISEALNHHETSLDLRLAKDFDSAGETSANILACLHKSIPDALLSSIVLPDDSGSVVSRLVAAQLGRGATLIQFEMQNTRMRVRAEIANVMMACELPSKDGHDAMFEELLMLAGVVAELRESSFIGRMFVEMEGETVALLVNYVPRLGEDGTEMVRLETKTPVKLREGPPAVEQPERPRRMARWALLKSLVREYCTTMPTKREEW